MCRIAVLGGARLAVLNADPTDYDPIATVVVNAPIGDTLGAVARILALPSD